MLLFANICAEETAMIESRRDWSEVVVSIQREVEWLMGDVVSRKPPVVRFSPKAWQPAIYVYETNREVVSLVDEALKSASKD